MMDLGFLTGFVAGLVWWEIGFLLVLLVGFGVSLFNESSIWTAVALFMVFGYSWGDNPSLWSTMSIIEILWMIGIYIGLGVIWSFYKWRTVVINIIESCSTNFTKIEIKDRIASKKDYDTLVFWIIFWPFSLFGYLFNDLFTDLIKTLMGKIYNVYDRISDKLLEKAFNK